MLKFLLLEKKNIILLIISLFVLIVANTASLYLPSQLGKLVDSFSLDVEFGMKVFLVVVVGLLFNLMYSLIINYVAERIGLLIRELIIKKLNSLDYSQIRGIESGKLINLLIADTNSIKFFLSSGFILILSGLFLLVSSSILMFRTNTYLATYIVFTLPILAILLIGIFSFAKKVFEKYRKAQDEMNNAIDSNIKRSLLARVSNAQDFELSKFMTVNDQSYELGVRISNIFSLVLPLFALFTSLVSLFVIRIGGGQVIAGSLTIGGVTEFVNYVTLFSAPLLIFAFVSNSIAQSITSSKRVNEFLSLEPVVESGRLTIARNEFYKLAFNSVSFKYDGADGNTLTEISFSVNRGESIGIVGSSGSGKSSVLNLIMRLYEPSGGDIEINELSYKKYKLTDLRNLISYVPQEIVVISGSIRENIVFGDDGSEHDLDVRLTKAIESSMVSEYIGNMDNGIDTLIGERGFKLSGGQQQRLTVARALMKNAPILILDDTTSKLDIITEKEMLKRIKKTYSDITTIIIASKIASIADCDKIIVLQEGVVADIGNLEYLKKNSAIFNQLMIETSNITTDIYE